MSKWAGCTWWWVSCPLWITSLLTQVQQTSEWTHRVDRAHIIFSFGRLDNSTCNTFNTLSVVFDHIFTSTLLVWSPLLMLFWYFFAIDRFKPAEPYTLACPNWRFSWQRLFKLTSSLTLSVLITVSLSFSACPSGCKKCSFDTATNSITCILNECNTGYVMNTVDKTCHGMSYTNLKHK